MKLLYRVFLICSILWAMVIFSFSMQTGDESSGLSDKITWWVIDTFYEGFDEFSVEKQESIQEDIGYIVRKTAHFCEYGLLACLVYMTTITGVLYRKNDKLINLWQRWWIKIGLITQGIVSGYAISDEVHQLFVSERSGALKDVLIDSAGGFTAVAGLSIIFAIAVKIKRRAD